MFEISPSNPRFRCPDGNRCWVCGGAKKSVGNFCLKHGDQWRHYYRTRGGGGQDLKEWALAHQDATQHPASEHCQGCDQIVAAIPDGDYICGNCRAEASAGSPAR